MNLDIEDMIAKCIPGGDLCDPQMVADDIRAYVERAQEPSTEIPTKPGLYWWREEEGEVWILVKAASDTRHEFFEIVISDTLIGSCVRGEWEDRMGVGQWLPCLPPMSPKPTPPAEPVKIPEGWEPCCIDGEPFLVRWGDRKWTVPIGAEVYHLVKKEWVESKGVGQPSGIGIMYRMWWVESEVKE